MHPLTLWLTSIAELGEREREQAMLRRRRDSGTEQPPPLTRDGRWAAAIHRWAESEHAAAPAAASAPATAAAAAVPQARFGCA
jgi:hypothetical protein